MPPLYAGGAWATRGTGRRAYGGGTEGCGLHSGRGCEVLPKLKVVRKSFVQFVIIRLCGGGYDIIIMTS